MSIKSILITGSSRGIGLELVKQLVNHATPPKIVIATCRKPQEAKELQNLAADHQRIHILSLDTIDFGSFAEVVKKVEKIVGDEGLNVLVNNAGILHRSKIDELTPDLMTSMFVTNSVAPVMLTKAFTPLLKKAAAKNSNLPLGVLKAAIINISSILGVMVSATTDNSAGYRESKAALNMSTRLWSLNLKSDGILVVAVHPGWVKTDMGGKNADLSVKDSTANIVKLLGSLSEKHNGGFVCHDGTEVPC